MPNVCASRKMVRVFVNCSYQKLAERAKTAKTQEHLIVEKDINRTFLSDLPSRQKRRIGCVCLVRMLCATHTARA